MTDEFDIAEIFTSVQGEGVWVGTPMLFIRLAGCNVGQYTGHPYEGELHIKDGDLPLLIDKKHSVCTTITGTRFLCDTNYHGVEKVSSERLRQMVVDSGLRHVCFTGGEPLLHRAKLLSLIESVQDIVLSHIETSGTVPLKDRLEGMQEENTIWVTCSPKRGSIIKNPNEWKFLYLPNYEKSEDTQFINNVTSFLDVYATSSQSRSSVFIQPINSVGAVDSTCLRRCIDLLQMQSKLPQPAWRLSVQLHKLLGLR